MRVMKILWKDNKDVEPCISAAIDMPCGWGVRSCQALPIFFNSLLEVFFFFFALEEGHLEHIPPDSSCRKQQGSLQEKQTRVYAVSEVKSVKGVQVTFAAAASAVISRRLGEFLVLWCVLKHDAAVKHLSFKGYEGKTSHKAVLNHWEFVPCFRQRERDDPDCRSGAVLLFLGLCSSLDVFSCHMSWKDMSHCNFASYFRGSGAVTTNHGNVLSSLFGR